MEKILAKVNDLFDVLTAKLDETKRLKADLDARAEVLKIEEIALKAGKDQLKADQASVKKVKDVVALKQSVAEDAAQLASDKAALQAEKEAFENFKTGEQKAIAAMKAEAGIILEEAAGTRNRLRAETAKLEEEKKNYRKKIVEELAKKVG